MGKGPRSRCQWVLCGTEGGPQELGKGAGYRTAALGQDTGLRYWWEVTPTCQKSVEHRAQVVHARCKGWAE